MKQLTIILLSILMISCGINGQKENIEENTEFLSALEMSALDSDGQEINFNIGYSIIFEKETIENCDLKSKEDVNDIVVSTSIRSVIRKEIASISKDKIDQIDKEILKVKINEQLNSGTMSLNGKTLYDCKLSLGLFSITER